MDVPFRPGQPVKAIDLQDIIANLQSRILGGKGVQVRSFGGRLIVTKDAKIRKAPVPCPTLIMSPTPYEPYALFNDTVSSKLFIGVEVAGGPARIYR